MFVDADSVPDSRWVQAMAAPFADPSVAGVSGVKMTRQTEFWARYIQLEYDFKYERMQASGDTDFVDSSTAAYRRDVFLSSGGFDTSLLEAEDTDLSFRLAEQGHRLVLVRDAIVYHTHPTTLGEFLRRKYQYAIWRAVTYSRHPRKAVFDTRTPQSQKIQAVIAYVLLPFAAGAFVWNGLACAALVLPVLFLLTTLRFALWCRRSSPIHGVVAPFVLLCSAYAGGAGAAVGFLKRLRPGVESTSLPVQ
jgi:cellulose synthase/poly-beta-1,6-N-acetylglucosamine synthase-like glycosyltransferase